MKPFEVDWDASDEHVCVLARLALARQHGWCGVVGLVSDGRTVGCVLVEPDDGAVVNMNSCLAVKHLFGVASVKRPVAGATKRCRLCWENCLI